jgi:hypothetical protein
MKAKPFMTTDGRSSPEFLNNLDRKAEELRSLISKRRPVPTNPATPQPAPRKPTIGELDLLG